MSSLRQLLEYGAYRAFHGLVRALPHRAARPLGRAMGSIGHRLDGRHRRVAVANIRAGFPELGEAEARELVRRCFRHFGAALCDQLSVTRFDPEGLCRLFTLEGWEHLLAAEAEGRGVFLLTAHLGNFEMLAYPVALYRGPAHFIARPADNPRLERALRGLRERFGHLRVPRRGAGRATLRALRAGGRVFILADHRVAPNEGIEIPFFGRPATTSTLTARLSLRCGSPVVPMFCYPERAGRFRVEVHAPIRPRGAGAEAVAALTRRYVAVVEDEIRRHPEMWLWMHDRWRHRRAPGAGG